MSVVYSQSAAGTFALNKGEPIHRWYPYLEGYSACLVDKLLQEIGVENVQTIYDPFCGTGTTPLVASKHDIISYYSETNPYMRLVIEAKTNCVKRLRDSNIGSRHLKKFLAKMQNYQYQRSFDPITWNGFEKYFDQDVLGLLLELRSAVGKISDGDTQKIAKVLLASVTVRASKMIRQGDLRFAKDTEKSEEDRDIIENFVQKLKDAIADIEDDTYPTLAETACLCEDSRDADIESMIDCVITSPPYLNGTNYIRNTKLELKLLDFVSSEQDLPVLHSKGIMAGINNVSKRTSDFSPPECVKRYLEELTPVAYDKRIPILVAGYFRDMEQVIIRLSHAVRDGGYLIMDIGDSQFAGIHIPTHEMLVELCHAHGFELYDEKVLRQRRSKNGMALSQRLLKFRLHKRISPEELFRAQAKAFIRTMPYRQAPYSGRNWGHPWHSLCSYHGKLKPAIAHFMIERFTRRGDIVLDPLCGVGTIPFEACLQGRIGVGNDLSELAYVVTKAKLGKPELTDCLAVVDRLGAYIAQYAGSQLISDDAARYADFGFNGKVSTYFHPKTYQELLCARRFFSTKISDLTVAEAMVYSCLLHILHGNRPYALSRNSHPLTPYAPTGEFVYKDTIEHIKDKLALSYGKGDFRHYIRGISYWGDYQQIKSRNVLADAVICSPPFAGSMRFYMQNWMRLWLCGWEPEDYVQADTRFLDQRQKKDFDVYGPFFELCSSVLKPGGRVILHLGRTNSVDMAEELAQRASPYFTEAFRGSENVQDIEKHGIADKGGTVEHQFLFLLKR